MGDEKKAAVAPDEQALAELVSKLEDTRKITIGELPDLIKKYKSATIAGRPNVSKITKFLPNAISIKYFLETAKAASVKQVKQTYHDFLSDVTKFCVTWLLMRNVSILSEFTTKEEREQLLKLLREVG